MGCVEVFENYVGRMLRLSKNSRVRVLWRVRGKRMKSAEATAEARRGWLSVCVGWMILRWRYRGRVRCCIWGWSQWFRGWRWDWLRWGDHFGNTQLVCVQWESWLRRLVCDVGRVERSEGNNRLSPPLSIISCKFVQWVSVLILNFEKIWQKNSYWLWVAIFNNKWI